MDAKAIQNATVRASVDATENDKTRARAAHLSLVQTNGPGLYFNAFLNLLHRGAPATEANILSESAKLIAADKLRTTERQTRRDSRAVA